MSDNNATPVVSISCPFLCFSFSLFFLKREQIITVVYSAGTYSWWWIALNVWTHHVVRAPLTLILLNQLFNDSLFWVWFVHFLHGYLSVTLLPSLIFLHISRAVSYPSSYSNTYYSLLPIRTVDFIGRAFLFIYGSQRSNIYIKLSTFRSFCLGIW